MNTISRGVLKCGALGLLFLASGCVPTISMHSYRNVAIRIRKEDSGEPVPALPFRVIYDYCPVDGPIYHLELRTPREVRGETDQMGESVIRLADYAWDIHLEIDANEKRYTGYFRLSKTLIRNGGTVEEGRYPHANPTFILTLQPTKRPNHRSQRTPRFRFVRISRQWRGAAAAERSAVHPKRCDE